MPAARSAGPVRVLIADDDDLVRRSLGRLIDGEEGLELVGAAADAGEAEDLAAVHHPDVALVDVKMPGGGGPAAARAIRARSPVTRVVALSAYRDRASVLEMLKAGAVGYLVKGCPASEIVETIHSSARGRGALSSEIAADVVDALAQQLERDERASEEHRTKAERIRRVMDEGLFSMHFQPIADLSTGRVVGAEALARFQPEPKRSPDLWFAEAEAVGLRLELELAAMRAALAQIGRLPADVYLAVNLSPMTLTSPEFADALDGIPAERVVVEVTEHAPVGDYTALGMALHEHRSVGVRLAVDDAGAGFASLRHILQLAPDLIKLDVELTRDIHRDRARLALASALISFATEMDLSMIAEGIETVAELATLRSLGVSCGQGYYLARPAPLPLPGPVIPVIQSASA